MAVQPLDADSTYSQQANFNLGKLTASVVVPSNVIVDGFTVYNSNAAAGFLCVLEGGVVPGNGAVPLFTVALPASSEKAVAFAPNGRFCENGLVLAKSTTDSTLTIGSADLLIDVQLRWPEP